MSIDKSLRGKNSLERHRNVLTRAERIDLLKEVGKWSDDTSPMGLPKVGHRKVAAGKKIKEVKTDDAEATDGAATPADDTKK